jgi:hypothetical protein
MREAKFTKSLTVVLPMGDYQKIKQITDDKKISMAQWVRKVVNMALESDAVEGEYGNTKRLARNLPRPFQWDDNRMKDGTNRYS